VEIFWSSSGCLHKGANAEAMSEVDGVLLAGAITNSNRDGTFVITYQDGDGDRRLNLLAIAGANTYTSNWGYEHELYEWSCLPH